MRKCVTRIVIQVNLSGKERCSLQAVIMKYQVTQFLVEVEWTNVISKYNLQKKSTKTISGMPCFCVSKQLTTVIALTIFIHCLSFLGYDVGRYPSKCGPCSADFWMHNNMCFFFLTMFHRAFFNSIIDKTPTHALFIQHYISLACRFH